jgi:tetratricopeptide (TPR) repeat protein
MNVVLLSLVLSSLAGFQRLADCVDQKDQACVEACLKDPPVNRSADYFALAARAYMLLGRRQEAVESIRHAIQLNPGRYYYLMEQGWLYQRSGDQVSAIESFLRASQIDPRSAAVFYELGMSFFLAKEYERAISHLQHALQLDPKNDKAEFMIGVVDIWMAQLEAAKLHFANALNLQPKNAHYLLHYGVLLARISENNPAPATPEENDLALANMLEARRLDPSNPLTHYQIGKRYRAMGKFAEAREELETAVHLRPNLAPALYQLGLLYRQLGDQSKAREELKEFETQLQREKTGDEDPIDANLAE